MFEIKALSECKSGQLVRPLRQLANGKFAIVADLDNNRRHALIVLQAEGPVYVIEEQPDQHYVLEYSDDLIFELDQLGPYSSGFAEMYGQVGCMVRDGARSLLNVGPQDPRFGSDIAQFNCQTFLLENVNTNSHNIAVFGKWQAYIGDLGKSREEWVRMASFEWNPQRGRGA